MPGVIKKAHCIAAGFFVQYIGIAIITTKARTILRLIWDTFVP